MSSLDRKIESYFHHIALVLMNPHMFSFILQLLSMMLLTSFLKSTPIQSSAFLSQQVSPLCVVVYAGHHNTCFYVTIFSLNSDAIFTYASCSPVQIECRVLDKLNSNHKLTHSSGPSVPPSCSLTTLVQITASYQNHSRDENESQLGSLNQATFSPTYNLWHSVSKSLIIVQKLFSYP